MENKYFTEKGIREHIERLTEQMKQTIAECEVLYRYDCFTEHAVAMEEVSKLAEEISDLADRLDNLYPGLTKEGK